MGKVESIIFPNKVYEVYIKVYIINELSRHFIIKPMTIKLPSYKTN